MRPLDSMPHTVPGLWIENLQLMEDVVHVPASGLVLIGTDSLLMLKAKDMSHLRYPRLFHKAERTNELEGIMLHLHLGKNGGSIAFVGYIHEPCGEDIVLMVTESHLVETSFRSKGEEEFPAMPGAKEALRLASSI